MNPYPHVSIIVPVFNRENMIGKCIESLLEVDYPSYDIIVVDNGSIDRTLEIVEQYPVTLIKCEQRGSYEARNKGVEKASGEIIAFTDSDCVVEKNWLKALIANYTHDSVGGVCGEIYSVKPNSVIETFCDAIGVNSIKLINRIEGNRCELRKDQNRFLSADFVTANCSVRRTVFEDIGGFDTDFKSGGDIGFGWSILKAGYKLIYEPDAIVLHKHRTSLWSLIGLFFKYGKDQPLLLKKHYDGRSYIRVKSYLWGQYEWGCRLPIPSLIDIDFCTLLILSVALTALIPFFLFVALGILFFILSGTLREALPLIRETHDLKWFILFPILHLVRDYSFIFGRIYGGLKWGVIAF